MRVTRPDSDHDQLHLAGMPENLCLDRVLDSVSGVQLKKGLLLAVFG